MAQRTAIPRQFSTPRAAKLRNWTLMTVIFVGFVMGPVSIIFAINAAQSAREAADSVLTEEPVHRAFAEAAAARWAFGGDSLPTSTSVAANYGRPSIDERDAEEFGLNPDLVLEPTRIGVTSLVWYDVSINPMGGGLFSENHRFLVTTESGMFWLTIPVSETPNDPTTETPQPALGGNPTLEPYNLSPLLEDITNITWDPSQGTDVTIGNNVESRIVEWANAYAADDQTALYDITGDNEDVTYRGLGGFTVAEVDIGQSIRNESFADAVIVRVHLTFASSRGVVIVSSYDLLVSETAAQRPNVIAWGAPGTGFALQPYGQAATPGTSTTGGFLPQQNIMTPPSQQTQIGEDGEIIIPDVDPQSIINDLQAGTSNTLRRVLAPSEYDIGDIARLVEDIDNAPPIVLSLDGEPDRIRERETTISLNARIGEEEGTVTLRLRWDDASNLEPAWRIMTFQSRNAPNHPLTTGEPSS